MKNIDIQEISFSTNILIVFYNKNYLSKVLKTRVKLDLCFNFLIIINY